MRSIIRFNTASRPLGLLPVSAKRNMSIIPIFIPNIIYNNPPAPRAPKPFRERYTPGEIKIFRQEYRNYYDYHYDDQGRIFSERLYDWFIVGWKSCIFAGPVIGMGVSLYENRSHPDCRIHAAFVGSVKGAFYGVCAPLILVMFTYRIYDRCDQELNHKQYLSEIKDRQ